MDIDTAISNIQRQRQAFAFGIEGVQTLYLHGTKADEPPQPLQTKVVEDRPFSSWLLPDQLDVNTSLKRSTANQLAMQLVVAVGDAVCDTPFGENWADHASPTIRFLRLVRNTAAHGNEIDFTGNDPRPNTVWRGFEFQQAMIGEPLFSQPKEFTWEGEKIEMDEGYMESGDAFVLTTDVLAELIDESDKYDESNIIGLSKNGGRTWEDW